MQITIRGELVQITNEQRQAIDNLMRTYSAAKRYAFNRYNDNLTSEDHLIDNNLKKQLMETFGLNARYSYAAMMDAKEVITSQRKLIPLELKDIESKIGKSKRKLKKVKDRLRRKGIEDRIKKLEKKRDFYKKHLKDGTIPHVIFGGKKTFRDLKNPDLSSEEREVARENWKDSRTNQLYSIGANIGTA